MYTTDQLWEFANELWKSKKDGSLYLANECDRLDICTVTFLGASDRWAVSHRAKVDAPERVTISLRTVSDVEAYLKTTIYNVTAHKFRCADCATIRYVTPKAYDHNLTVEEAAKLLKAAERWSITKKHGAYCTDCARTRKNEA